MTGLSAEIAFLLVAISLLGGVGITAIGPGGILITVALYAMTSLPPAEVAGTALVTFTATGIVGSIAYVRSGELRPSPVRRLAIVLSLTAVLGAFVGARLNLSLPPALFGPLLAAFTAAVGVTVVYRAAGGRAHRSRLELGSARLHEVRAGIAGVVIGVLCGFFGVGGPVVAVPVLVLLGVPMLTAIAVSQVQSVFLASSATISYAAVGAVSLPMALLVGIPQLLGVVVGWWVAHRVDQRRLRFALGLVLVMLSPVLLLSRGVQ